MPVFSAVKTEYGTEVEEKLREFIYEGLPHVNSTIRHALPAALDLGSIAFLVYNGSGCKVGLEARQIRAWTFVVHRVDA